MTGVMGYFYRDGVRHTVKFGLYSSINQSYVIDSTRFQNIRITWEHMQSKLRCCGVVGYKDWFYSSQWPKHRFVPDSCCDASFFKAANGSMRNCGKSEANGHLFYKQGCYELFTDWLLEHLYIVGVVALLFALVEVVVLTTSLRLIFYLNKREKQCCDEPSYKYTRNGSAIHDGECSLITSNEE